MQQGGVGKWNNTSWCQALQTNKVSRWWVVFIAGCMFWTSLNSCHLAVSLPIHRRCIETSLWSLFLKCKKKTFSTFLSHLAWSINSMFLTIILGIVLRTGILGWNQTMWGLINNRHQLQLMVLGCFQNVSEKCGYVIRLSPLCVFVKWIHHLPLCRRFPALVSV